MDVRQDKSFLYQLHLLDTEKDHGIMGEISKISILDVT